MKHRDRTLFFLTAFSILVLIGIPLIPAVGQVETSETVPHKTTLGAYVNGGINLCLGGGTQYATCRTPDSGWLVSWGFSGGILVRPFRYFSIGLDVSYMNLRSRVAEDSDDDDIDFRWADFTAGPVGRLHVPIKTQYVIVEPKLGLQTGYIQGNRYRWEDGRTRKRKDIHMGPFLGFLGGIDFTPTPLPSLAFGIEARIVRSLYQEVCFEGRHGHLCRGVDDQASNSWIENEEEYYPGDGPIAKYPWKLNAGVNVTYYF
ncbi:MAG: hypothetical protein QNJ97_09385 [Myxococcota bacterium]|nr:hypothetical protein [Myxococcota bacterium]